MLTLVRMFPVVIDQGDRVLHAVQSLWLARVCGEASAGVLAQASAARHRADTLPRLAEPATYERTALA